MPRIIESGDTANQLNNWQLSGVTANNSDGYKLYWNLSDLLGGQPNVELYKTSAGVLEDRVAVGSRTGNGLITLSESNSSGVSGSVTVVYSADDTDLANNTLQIRQDQGRRVRTRRGWQGKRDKR